MSSIGEILFNKLYIIFISAAILLFIAMIGAIVLTIDDDYTLLKEEEKKEKNLDSKFFSFNIN